MNLELSKPILYLITRGASTEATTPKSLEFKQILEQISAAVTAGIDLIQLREKRLTARVLFELTARSAALTRGTAARLLVNDRADVAAGGGADGVHLTTQSIDARTIRQTFGHQFVIGASTHSLAEARAAKDGGADFIVFGPVFATASKQEYGPPVGIGELARVASELQPLPVLALGGVNGENAGECFHAGASGIAGISLFADHQRLSDVVTRLRQ
jgi:thiamine-phosphate pyrophosphorylase